MKVVDAVKEFIIKEKERNKISVSWCWQKIT